MQIYHARLRKSLKVAPKEVNHLAILFPFIWREKVSLKSAVVQFCAVSTAVAKMKICALQSS